MSNEWGLSTAWNAATMAQERPVEARERIWASELGKGIADIVLKMRGTAMTNPPNGRSLRKFEVGNVFEWIVRLVLLRAGILISTQDYIVHQYEGLLPVTGKLDFMAGGIPTWDPALDMLDQLEMPEVLARSMKRVFEYLKERFPEGMVERLLEVKSVSSFMFEALEKTEQATKNHRMQVAHYLIGKGLDYGTVVYICRDDLRMMEVTIYRTPELEEEYRTFIEEVSRVYYSGEMPPLEPPIYYDVDVERFAKNWNIAYSSYLTMLYGYKDQAEFDEIYKPIADKWNRVLNRARAGKELTKNNLEAVEHMRKEGFVFEELVARMKEPLPEGDNEEAV